MYLEIIVALPRFTLQDEHHLIIGGTQKSAHIAAQLRPAGRQACCASQRITAHHITSQRSAAQRSAAQRDDWM
jgi:hypothetical protein